MPVTLYDDMLDASNYYEDSDGFIAALVRYGITGEMPSSDRPWFPTFLVLMGRIEMNVSHHSKSVANAEARSQAARKAANARWSKSKGQCAADAESDAEPCDRNADAHAGQCERNADACADAPCDGDAPASCGVMPMSRVEESRVEESRDILSGKIDEVIEFLNETCGTKYRKSGKATRKLIRARLNDGFDVEDLKTVITNMSGRWGGDPKMAEYLRPETLFRQSHFESYLNAGGRDVASEFSIYDEGEEEWDYGDAEGAA